MKKRYAVMGSPIAHSLSPKIHQAFAAQLGIRLEYEKILIDEPLFAQQVQAFFGEGGLGLNVTVPCKTQAYFLSKQATARCHHAKAANTLWMEKGILHADNTDGIGWLRDIGRYRSIAHQHILIWGAGGATRGILEPLFGEHPASVMVVNRSSDKLLLLQKDFPKLNICTFEAWPPSDHYHYNMVVHATSMHLQQDSFQLAPHFFQHQPFCYDLAYQTMGNTPFVSAAQQAGCEAIDGLGMLVEQAAESFRIWHGVLPNTLPVLAELRKECGHSIR